MKLADGFWISVIALGLLGLCSAQSQTPDTALQIAAQTELQPAESAFAAHQYRQAIALCSALETGSAAPEIKLAARLLEAKSRINLLEFASAEKALDEFLLARPTSSEAMYLLGYVLERENKPRDSLAIYNRAAALRTPTADDLKLVGLDYVLLDDDRGAIQWLKRSVAGDPANAEAWYFLGRSSMQVGEFKAAEEAFRQALKLTPQDTKALDNLGLSLEAQNRNDEALVAYKQAVELPPAQTSAPELPFLDFGALLNNENRFQEALPYLRKAVLLGDRNIRCREELARAQAETGDTVAALASLQQAIVLDPANPQLHFRLSQLYRRTGEKLKADQEAKRSALLYGSHSTEGQHREQ